MNSSVYALAMHALGRCWSHYTIFLILPCLILIRYFIKRYIFVRSLSWIPGPPGLPILGNSLSLTGGQIEFFRLLIKYSREYGPIFKLWIGMRPFVFISGAEYAQPILNSKLNIDKSREYKFLHPWIGTGLVTSNGSKWHQRRKLLTPTFHYSILEDFIELIVEQNQILIECLSRKVNQSAFDVMAFTKLFALDVICVTAMGKCINAQVNEDHEYVKAVEGLSKILQRRFITPWLKPDFIFSRSQMGKKQKEYVKTIHGFTDKIIQERKKYFHQSLQLSDETKKKKPLLELILMASENGDMLTDEDIRDEVNTFMFAGHDTTSVAIGWFLFVIGNHPEAQEKILQEYENVVKNERIPRYNELQKLEYLECCIKEVMRLYPVVPLLARDIKYDVPIKKNKILPGVTALIFGPALHRDPEYFSLPNDFKPERFLEENRDLDNPFAYIPFSAGPRNCIGSKFAMIVLKLVLHQILKNYIVISAHSGDDLNLYSEIVLLNRDGIQIQLKKRK